MKLIDRIQCRVVIKAKGYFEETKYKKKKFHNLVYHLISFVLINSLFPYTGMKIKKKQ